MPSSGGVLYFPRSAGACVVSSSITIANPTAVVSGLPVRDEHQAGERIECARLQRHLRRTSAFYNLTINANGIESGQRQLQRDQFCQRSFRADGARLRDPKRRERRPVHDLGFACAGRANTLSGAGNDQFNYETTASVASSDIKFVDNTVDSTAITTSFVAVYAVDAIGAGSTVTDVTVDGNTVHIPLTSANETDGIVVNGNTDRERFENHGGGEQHRGDFRLGLDEFQRHRGRQGRGRFRGGAQHGLAHVSGNADPELHGDRAARQRVGGREYADRRSGNQGTGVYLNDQSRTMRVAVTANTIIGWHTGLVINSSNTTASGNAIALTSANNYGHRGCERVECGCRRELFDGHWHERWELGLVHERVIGYRRFVSAKPGGQSELWNDLERDDAHARGGGGELLWNDFSSPYTLGTGGGVPAGVTVIDDNGALGDRLRRRPR